MKLPVEKWEYWFLPWVTDWRRHRGIYCTNSWFRSNFISNFQFQFHFMLIFFQNVPPSLVFSFFPSRFILFFSSFLLLFPVFVLVLWKTEFSPLIFLLITPHPLSRYCEYIPDQKTNKLMWKHMRLDKYALENALDVPLADVLLVPETSPTIPSACREQID